jgi:adenylate cyclase
MKKTLFLIFLILLNNLIFSIEQIQSEKPEIIRGSLDLSEYPLELQGEIRLDGQWEFYWNELLEPKDFTNNVLSEKRTFLQIPGNWSDVNNYQAHGFATVRLIVSGLNPEIRYSLYIPEMITSFRFFIDGREVYRNGTVGRDSKSGRPQFLPGTVSFESPNGTMTIICQISNYDHRNNGIWRSIKLGTESTIKNSYRKNLLLEMFLSSVLLAISIFHIGIFFYRSEAKAELLFGLTCLILFFRTMTTGEQLINVLIPAFPWEIARRMEYSPFYLLAPLFMTFITSLFPEESVKTLNRIFITLFSILGAFYIILPVRITNYAILPAEMLLIAGILYAFVILIRALAKKRSHSLSIITAFTILAIASINDILFSQGLISTMYLAPLGFILFIIIQSQMLSRRYAHSFRKVQMLSHQLKDINESLSRFVPFQFLDYLKKNSILDVNLGDQVLENMTILFADIRSFTALSEVMSPEENFKFLNSFLSQVVPVIREQGGFVDKFIGDAIMALFPSTPDKAVKAAIELQNAVKRYNEARNRAGYREISLGIGIHTGQLMLGTIGETNRMETTVIADAVNIASRLEQLTKKYGSKIIISSELFNKIEDRSSIISRSLGEAPVKGKSLPLEIVEILDGCNKKHDQLIIDDISDFESAVGAIRDLDYHKAEILLQKVLKKNPDDRAAAYFHRHCIDGLENRK